MIDWKKQLSAEWVRLSAKKNFEIEVVVKEIRPNKTENSKKSVTQCAISKSLGKKEESSKYKHKRLLNIFDAQDSIENHSRSILNESTMRIDRPNISISLDEFRRLTEEVHNLDLFYECLVYDVTIYKQMIKSFNVILPLRETNKVKIEQILVMDSVTNVSWEDYQRLLPCSNNRFGSMVNLFNVLQYKFGGPPIKIKNPLDPKKDMPSARQFDLMYDADKNSKDHEECLALMDYYTENKK
jgi:hypothetical protein